MKHTKSVPPHLPNPPRDSVAYQRLYANSVDLCLADFTGCPEIRIRSGSSAAEVYRSLPSAKDFEYAGYLTATRIRYVPAGPTVSHTDSAKPCTFHSHPYVHPNADVPSPLDIYQFLKCRHLRSITVGARWIWFWTKDHQNLKTVRRLMEWEEEHLLAECGRACRSSGDDWIGRYIELALRRLGLRWPQRQPITDPTRWSASLRKSLGIKTSLIRRATCR